MTTRLSSSFALSVVCAALAGCAVEVGDDVGAPDETIDDETNDQTGDVGIIEALGAMEYNVAVEGDTESITPGPVVNGYKANGALYGKGGFEKYGDIFWANDYRSGEGYDIGIHWEDATSGRQGLCRLRVVLGYCNKNLPEGDTIRYQVGRCKPSTSDCTRWVNYGDRSAFKSTTNNN